MIVLRHFSFSFLFLSVLFSFLFWIDVQEYLSIRMVFRESVFRRISSLL
jgi:hypothetical protein